MTEKQLCGNCGSDLPANAPQGLCPQCLASLAVSFANPVINGPTVPRSHADTKPASGQIRSFGDYELLEEIARGGMGVVFRARQVSLDRIVAVKMLLFGQFSSDEFVKRFHLETQAVARLQHSNIVAIHEVGEHEGQRYFSMEYVAGKSLSALVQESPLPARRAAGYIRTIAEAIHYAHQRGVLHRDLKPSNVLIDEFDQPHITDFGLAKQLKGDSALTLTGQVIGSPNYMPPEQAEPGRGAASAASDVYSLGAILYHLLTGRPPFLAPTLEATLRQLLDREPVAPRWLNASVPRDLETICLKCLAKRSERRYSSAQELAEDLGRFLRSEPVRARPSSFLEKFWRLCRRQPALASTMALICILAMGSTWTALHLQRMLEEARQNAYAADMNLALLDCFQGSTAQALDHLTQHIPAKRQADLRGFEWRHLWSRCHGNHVQELPVHQQIVGSLQFSTDGEQLAVYTWNKVLTVWNLKDRKKFFASKDVTAFGGFCPDGSGLVASRGTDLLQLLNASTGATNRVIPDAGIAMARMAQNWNVITIGHDEVLKVLSLTNSQVRLALTNVAPRRLDFGYGYPFAISSDGKILAMIETNTSPLKLDVAIRLWDVTTRKQLTSLPLNRQVRCLEFSPDCNVLAVGDGDGNVLLWSLRSHENPPLIIKAHQFPVLSMAFSPDGRTLATGSSDKKCIRLWNVGTGSPISKMLPGQIGDVWALAFSPNGKFLASGTRDGPIRIWDLEESVSEEIVEEHLHADEYGNFVFSPDGQWMAGGCSNNTVKIWAVGTLKLRSILTNATYVAAFSKDGQRVLVSTLGGIPHWRNVDDSKARAIPHYSGNLTSMLTVVLTPNCDVAALGLADGSIHQWRIDSGQPAASPLVGHTGPVLSLALSPSGDKLASGGKDKWVRVWDLKSGMVVGGAAEHKGAVCAVAFSPNGKILASGCGAETIKLWDASNVSSGSTLSVSRHKSVIRTLAFSPDGQILASGSEDDTVKLWRLDLTRARPKLREVASFPHEAHLRMVIFSPDGNALATITDRGTLRIFKAPSLKEVDQAMR